MIFIGFLVAAIVGGIVAADAKKRGMSAVAWFFGVWLMMIVFLPIYLIVRKPLLPEYQAQLPQPPQAPFAIPYGIANLCPHCGKYYAGNANFCQFCGNPVTVQLHGTSTYSAG